MKHPDSSVVFLAQAWLDMVNVEKEIKARGLKPAFGPMSTVRNKRLLLKTVEDEDETTMKTFQVRATSY